MSILFNNKFCLRVVFIALFSIVILWCTSSVMRESDQASVIDGSLQLAQDGEVLDRGFYNYDRTFVSYWILSSIYSLSGIEYSDADAVVRRGNIVAAVILLLGLVAVFVLYGPTQWSEWIIACSCLLCPVFLFSAPLLSSNVISAGFLFVLVICLRGRENWYNHLIVGIIGFLAVGARADAILVMPLLACLSVRESRLMFMLKSGRLWILAGSCVLALLLGSWLSSSGPYNPSKFFNAKVFIAYLVFSMNGSLLVLVAFSLFLFKRSIKSRDCFPFLVLVALMIPLMFYGGLLYSPRHLLTTVLVILFTVMFPRGCEYWRFFTKTWFGRYSVLVVGLVTLIASFVGLGMSSATSGKLVLQQPTVYPTTDGFWPMGANLFFYNQLKNADNVAIDHNQRVWRAWASIDEDDLPEFKLSVNSYGLVSYGELRLTMLGRQVINKNSVFKGTGTLIDGRSLLKFKKKPSREHLNRLVNVKSGVSRLSNVICKDAAVFCIRDDNSERDTRWDVLQNIKKIAEGDDYVVMKSSSCWEELAGRGGYEWLVITPSWCEDAVLAWAKSLPEMELIQKLTGEDWQVYGYMGELGQRGEFFSELPKAVWVARMSLPSFMQSKLLK